MYIHHVWNPITNTPQITIIDCTNHPQMVGISNRNSTSKSFLRTTQAHFRRAVARPERGKSRKRGRTCRRAWATQINHQNHINRWYKLPKWVIYNCFDHIDYKEWTMDYPQLMMDWWWIDDGLKFLIWRVTLLWVGKKKGMSRRTIWNWPEQNRWSTFCKLRRQEKIRNVNQQCCPRRDCSFGLAICGANRPILWFTRPDSVFFLLWFRD